MKYISLTTFAILGFITLGVLTVQSVLPTVVHAQNPIEDQLCGAEGRKLNPEACSTSNNLLSPDGLFKDILNIFSIIIGLVAVIVIVIAGFRFVVSGGDPQNVAGARNQIIYAIVGIVVAIFAQVIVRFILTRT